MPSLRQKQSKFARMVAQLINHATLLGYEVTFGEAYRFRNTKILVKGKWVKHGSPRSVHPDRLAIDLNLFKNGRYLRSTKAHTPLGEYWESIGGAWGGRFDDGNHYSLEHKGRK